MIGDARAARAATLAWKGRTWQVSSGGIAGVCPGNPNNVTVDAAGYLHLKITNSNGMWSASELFTTDKLGFGTYQWQIDGPIDTFDKNVVLGLFPYGPAAGIGADGTNEIDIEYARWGQANGPNGDWTNYPASGSTIGELSYSFSLGGATLSTSRFVWSSTSITDFLFAGLQPVEGMAGLIKTWTYMPQNPTVNIPQQPLPLGMNLWCFNAPPSDGSAVEIVIRDFTFTAAGSSTGTGGTGGSGGTGGRGGTGGTGGGGGGGGAGASGGAAGSGSAGSQAGSSGGGTSAAGAGGGPGAAGGSTQVGGRGGGNAGSSGAVGGSDAGAAGSEATAGRGGAGAGGSGLGGGGGNQGCSCGIKAASDQAEPGWLWMLFAGVMAWRRLRRRGPAPDVGATDRL